MTRVYLGLFVMKLAVIGSRGFNNFKLLKEVLDSEDPISLIISGGAKGADTLAVNYARINLIPFIEYKADWDNIDHPNAIVKVNKYGKKYDASAGFRRNQTIVEEADKVIAFWDGLSKGTEDSLKRAKVLGKKIKIVKYKLIELNS